jgi:integral membrane sensor domain MASE1
MIPRGEVSLIFAQIGLAGGLLSQGLFTAITVMVIVTAFLTPLLLRRMLRQSTPEESLVACDVVMEPPMEDEQRRSTADARESYETPARP